MRQMAEFDVLKEYARMVKPGESGVCTIDCDDCPISKNNNGMKVVCYSFLRLHPEKATEIIRKWSEEHPQKTLGDLVLEHFPDARMNFILPCAILGSKWKSENCKRFDDCEECNKAFWNEVVE